MFVKSVKFAWLIVLGMCLIVLTGCPPTPASPSTPAFRLTPLELAQRLDLDITDQTDRYIEMKNGTNRVLIFLHDGGKVYVNQNPIGITGQVVRSNNTIYLPEILENLIRPNLQSKYVPSKPIPSQPVLPHPPVKPVSGLIIIDAGHGGKDPGTLSTLGYTEKTVNLKISLKVVANLKARGFQVRMIRSSDTFIDKYDRAEMTNRIDPDLFVSIHCDSHASKSMRGYTVYVSRSASGKSTLAASQIEKAMNKTGLSSKGVREADYIVLVNSNCPAILVECGYLSNPREAALLNDSKFQDRLAAAIAGGIANAMSSM